jgi:hypothetical protein
LSRYFFRYKQGGEKEFPSAHFQQEEGKCGGLATAAPLRLAGGKEEVSSRTLWTSIDSQHEVGRGTPSPFDPCWKVALLYIYTPL